MCLQASAFKGLRIVNSGSDVPDSPNFVTVSREEGAKLLRALTVEANGSRRYVVDRKGKTHEVRMAFCCNPKCRSGIASTEEVTPTMVDAAGVYGIRLSGVTPPTNLAFCSACKNTQYCGRDCQKEHWKQHKVLCDKLRDHLLVIRVPSSKCGPMAFLGSDCRGMSQFGFKLSLIFDRKWHS